MKNYIVSRKAEHKSIAVDSAMTLLGLVNRDLSHDVDFVWVILDGIHTRRVNSRSTKLYILVSGELNAFFDGTSEKLVPGDVCIVPPGVACSLEGVEAEIGIVCVPSFDPNDEQIF
jgi:mannose-6-phosphate isomerase-like protein (cupin superfamily)